MSDTATVPHEISLDDYAALLGSPEVSELRALAEGLKGRSLVMVNSTAVGGGAADDPESGVVLAEVRDAAEGDPDIHILELPAWSALEALCNVPPPSSSRKVCAKALDSPLPKHCGRRSRWWHPRSAACPSR